MREFDAGVVEILIYGFQALRSNGLDSNQRPLDVSAPHCLEEGRVFRRFHGDLSEEDAVAGKLRQPLHQGETLRAYRLQRAHSVHILLPTRQIDVGKGYRIEVVVGERDEAIAQASE